MKHGTINFLLILVSLFATGLTHAAEKDTRPLAAMSTGQILQHTVVILADEIRSSVSGGQFSRVAVMPFTTLQGEVNDLGLYISDKLTNELSGGEDHLQMVERSQINQALAEMQLGETGLLSEETIQETGQALGVDAVIVGTIFEIGGEVDITLRVFSVSTLKILGKASQLIEKNEVIESLLSRTTPLVDASRMQSGARDKGNDESSASLQNGDVFFKEDFSGIEEGLIPEGWIGGTSLAVRPSEHKSKSNALGNFKKGKHQFTIPNILFPENWKFEIECLHSDLWYAHINIKIGDVTVKLYRGIVLNDINTGKLKPPGNQVNLFTIEKSGSVVKLFMNSEKIHVIRLENPEPPTGINLSFDASVEIYRLEGTRLP